MELNGAGKTTIIRILSTLIEPTSGTASICGHDVRTDPAAARACLGVVMAGERHLYWKLTGRENLEYFATLYHVPARAIPGRIRAVLDRLGLSERADELVERYSTGMRQRLSLARALLHDPPALLLDEPTLGLDPQAARTLRELVLELKAEGRAILLTTHYMDEGDFLCDRVAIINHGRIVACDTPEALKRRLPGQRLFRLGLAGADGHLERLRRHLPDLHVVDVHQEPGGSATSLTLTLPDGRRDTADVVHAVFAEGLQLLNFSVKEPTLEDVFIAMTGRALRD
ncbi:MAG: ABC transporter ATP-binding protein [Bacillota bacterium]